MAPRAKKPAPPPDPTKLRRESPGRYVSGDGRFTVEQGSAGWMVLDAEQTNEFGLPLTRGPFGSLEAARVAIAEARESPAPASELAERIAKLPKKAATPRRSAKGAGQGTGSSSRTRAEAAEPPPPLPVVVREYRSGDGDRLRALWDAVEFRSPGDDDASLRRFAQRNPGTLLVAVQGDEIVASALGGWDGRRGWIYHVATAPGHRRQGHAAALVRRIEERLRELGAARVNVIVTGDNGDGAAFWEALGYADRQSRQFGKDLG